MFVLNHLRISQFLSTTHLTQKKVPSILSQRTGASGVRSPSPLVLHASLGPFPKLGKASISFAISVCPSVYPHGKARLSLDGFS